MKIPFSLVIALSFVLIVAACAKQAPTTPGAPAGTGTPPDAAGQVDVSTQEKQVQQYTEQTSQALQSGDVGACAGITDARFKTSCVDNVLLKTATDKNDIQTCQRISTEGVRNSCEDAVFFKTAVTQKNAVLCDSIKEPSMKTACANVVRG